MPSLRLVAAARKLEAHQPPGRDDECHHDQDDRQWQGRAGGEPGFVWLHLPERVGDPERVLPDRQVRYAWQQG